MNVYVDPLEVEYNAYHDACNEVIDNFQDDRTTYIDYYLALVILLISKGTKAIILCTSKVNLHNKISCVMCSGNYYYLYYALSHFA